MELCNNQSGDISYWVNNKIYHYYDESSDSTLTCNLDCTLSLSDDPKYDRENTSYNPLRVVLAIKSLNCKHQIELKYRDIVRLQLEIAAIRALINTRSPNDKQNIYQGKITVTSYNARKELYLDYDIVHKTMNISIISEGTSRFIVKINDYIDIVVFERLINDLANNYVNLNATFLQVCSLERLHKEIRSNSSNEILLEKGFEKMTESVSKIVVENNIDPVKEDELTKEFDEEQITKEDNHHQDFIDNYLEKEGFDTVEDNKPDEKHINPTVTKSITNNNLIDDLLNRDTNYLSTLYHVVISANDKSNELTSNPIQMVMETCNVNNELLYTDYFYRLNLYSIYTLKMNKLNFINTGKFKQYKVPKFTFIIDKKSELWDIAKSTLMLYFLYNNIISNLSKSSTIDQNLEEYIELRDSLRFIKEVMLVFAASIDYDNLDYKEFSNEMFEFYNKLYDSNVLDGYTTNFKKLTNSSYIKLDFERFDKGFSKYFKSFSENDFLSKGTIYSYFEEEVHDLHKFCPKNKTDVKISINILTNNNSYIEIKKVIDPRVRLFIDSCGKSLSTDTKERITNVCDNISSVYELAKENILSDECYQILITIQNNENVNTKNKILKIIKEKNKIDENTNNINSADDTDIEMELFGV